ncbi:uncharacterized protein LOC109846256 [Asparagus officinalis]|uniref:uncharacterized protein LOC109846256 n=1 Tax=Asparagus officinalis TaxID=4686 RepID=UPI00098DF657|nr:uncharacterized protein LOC109846256 [Asparagus officinalis]
MDSDSTLSSNKHHLFMDDSSSSSMLSCGGWDSNQQKRQRSTVTDEYDEPVTGEILVKNSLDLVSKNKKPMVYDTDCQKEVQDASSEDFMSSSIDNVLESDALEEAQNSAEPDAEVSNSNLSDLYDDYYENEDENEDEYYAYDDDMIDNDYNYGLAAKFDDLDLPPGVEATVPWLDKPASESQRKDKNIVLEENTDVRYKSFKQFDTVEDYSDHHYAAEDKDVKKVYLAIYYSSSHYFIN